MSPVWFDTATTLAQGRWRGTGDPTHQVRLGLLSGHCAGDHRVTMTGLYNVLGHGRTRRGQRQAEEPAATVRPTARSSAPFETRVSGDVRAYRTSDDHPGETTRMGADRDHQTCSDTTRPLATTVAVFLARTIWPQAGPLCSREERLSRAQWDQQSDVAQPADQDGDP
jgi:hypothetical protein